MNIRLSWIALPLFLLTIGIFFRFYKLDFPPVWQDEAWSLVRTAGYTEKEIRKELFVGESLPFRVLDKFAHPLFSGRSMRDVFRVSREFPHIPPLFEILLWVWIRLWGDSLASIRALPALLGLLSLPCAYWLCRELYGSSRAGWIAAALMSVSPFHVIYSREIRNYSIWTLSILFSGAALLYALRTNRTRAWALYAVSAVVGLYSHLFMALVLTVHLLYVLLQHRSRIRNCIFALVSASVIYLPQIQMISHNFERVLAAQSWNAIQEPMLLNIKRILTMFSTALIDLNVSTVRYFYDTYRSLGFLSFIRPYAIIGVNIFIFTTVGYLIKRGSRGARWFVLLLLLSVLGPFLIIEIIGGGRRIFLPRYLTPSLLAAGLAVVFWLSSWWNHKTLAGRIFCRGVFISVLIGGMFTCMPLYNDKRCWNKGRYADVMVSVTDALNRCSAAVVVWDDFYRHLLHAFFELDEDAAGRHYFIMQTVGKRVPLKLADIDSEKTLLLWTMDPQKRSARLFDNYQNLAYIPLIKPHADIRRKLYKVMQL